MAGCGSAATMDRASVARSAECEPYRPYQGHDGTTVSMLGPVTHLEANKLAQAWRHFVNCTGIRIDYKGSSNFEKDLQDRVDKNDLPDIALFSQPGQMQGFVADGKLKPASAAVNTAAQKGWSTDWQNYGMANGTRYATPLGASVKSLVWYSPQAFKKRGYEVPESWDDLIALSDRIAASGAKPWCAGIESGAATGWPATDWIEDVALRLAGPAVYDRWVKHEITFNDPQIVAVVDKAGTILRNPRYVNGGYAGVASIATTSYVSAGLPLLTGKCTLHRQASFYGNQWPRGTKVAEDGDIFAFYLPPIDPAKGKPVLVAGDFVAAFADRPEVEAVWAYLASAEFAASRAPLGGWVSANKNIDLGLFTNPVDRLSAEILRDPKSVARFDASDQMPAKVGAGSFWTGMTAWIKGQGTRATLDAIEASWP
nr:ABC transporter substrate-binding protein [Actinoplanes siamensis]